MDYMQGEENIISFYMLMTSFNCFRSSIFTQVFLDTVETHSQISGYSIIWHTSEVMLVSKVCHPATFGVGQFKWIHHKYLGVKMCANILLTKVLEKWKPFNPTL